MNPWIPHLLRAGGGGGGPVLPPAGRTLLTSLTSSLILDEGTGGPTWSRATKAWGFNELGYLEELPSGCAFFGGARLVRNLAPRSEVVNAGWMLGGVTASDANTLLESAGGTTHQCGSAITTLGTYLLEVWMKRGAGSTRHVRLEVSSTDLARVNFNLDTGAVASIAQSGSLSLISYGADADVDASGYRRFYIRVNASASVSNTFYAARLTEGLNGSVSYSGDGTSSILVSKVKISDVTGYDASYIPEYVSVGVIASPFFGAGIDGAKYFETDWQGAPIAAANLNGYLGIPAATNNLLHCRDLTRSVNGLTGWNGTQMGSEVLGPVSAYTARSSISSATAPFTATCVSNGSYGVQFTGLTIGKTYVVTITVSANSASKLMYASMGTNNYTIGSLTGLMSIQGVCASQTSFILYISDGIVGESFTISAISIKEAVVQCTRTTGLDGIANTATTLTAAAADAIILQPTSGIASAARCASAYVKRKTGAGTISFTQDGTNWTDITAQINSSTWSRVEITSTLANPSVGFKISTSGDEIDVDCVQNEAGVKATNPIVTTTATVSRGANSLSYQTASNWSDTAGTAFIEAEPESWSVVSGGAIGSATNGLLLSSANSGATAYDGTNAANGPVGVPSGREKLAMRWTGSVLDVASSGALGTPGTYDGTMNLSSIAVGAGVTVPTYFKNLAIYSSVWTDDETKANVT